jgi:hypothetical protein
VKRSGQLAYGKEFQINVFKIQSGICYASTFGCTACRVTGVTLHGHFCCARLNTPPPRHSLSLSLSFPFRCSISRFEKPVPLPAPSPDKSGLMPSMKSVCNYNSDTTRMLYGFVHTSVLYCAGVSPNAFYNTRQANMSDALF